MEQYRTEFRVRTMCRVLQLTRSSYHYWRKHESSPYRQRNVELVQEIRCVHEASHRTYGSPRIAQKLRATGIVCTTKRVAKLMREHNIRAKTKKRFKITTDSTRTKNASPNLVKQEFHAERPNQLWTSDMTYVWTLEGWLYLAVILDVYGRRIVGYAMSHRIDAALVAQAIRCALTHRTIAPGLVFHSDRGSQYASDTVRTILTAHKMDQSMSGAGNCYDNAITETFFHTLKTELIYWERFETREEARSKIFEYIEVFYNRQRLHSSLGYLTPVGFEQQSNINH